MGNKQNRNYQAWIWAVVLNVVVFGLFYGFVLSKVTVADSEPQTPVIADNQGQAGGPDTQLITETSPGSVVGTESLSTVDSDTSGMQDMTESDTSWEVPETPEVPEATIAETPAVEDSISVPENTVWFNEFYLDRGEIVSLAPRLNEDGSLRELEIVNGRPKAPTYEDVDETFDSKDHIPPRMDPPYFSLADLPEEYRDEQFDIRVKLHIDARGRILGSPEFVRSSGIPYVDRFVINKLLNDVTFEPAHLIETNEPRTVWVIQPIFFE